MNRTQILGSMFLAASLPFGTVRAQTPASLQTQINELRAAMNDLTVKVDDLDKEVEALRVDLDRDNEITNAKVAKAQALVSRLAQAKSLFVASPTTTSGQIVAYNSGAEGDGPGSRFSFLAPFLKTNGVQPDAETGDPGSLLGLENMPLTGVNMVLGTVDDSRFGGTNKDVDPVVSGYP
jgi:outer membrane murein-binding lipoprotein Lpp